MYPSIYSRFPVIQTTIVKKTLFLRTPASIFLSRGHPGNNRSFHVPQPTFLFPLETPLRLSRNMMHGSKDNSMLAKPLTACIYLAYLQ